ncbi:MAG: BrnA antitoxin family protein [Spirochaetales bacterium]|nr:BrnA antitoxin family protein [Spirochaetales bacterium]
MTTKIKNIMHTMTLDEVRNLPPLSEEEIENVMSFNNTDFSDCPKQTKDELAKFRPWHEVHNCPTNSAKTNVNINIDTDVLAWYQSIGNDYQTKINDVLRMYAFGRME